MTIEEKMKNLRKTATMKAIDLETDAKLFHFQIKGYLIQAIDILFTSLEAKMIPFIKSSPTFFYLQNIAMNFLNVPNVLTIKAKSFLTFSLYKSLNKNNLETIKFEEFIKIINEEDLKKQLNNLELVKGNNVNFHTIKENVNEIISNLNDKIDKYLNK